MKWWDWMPWSLFFWILGFNSAFSLSFSLLSRGSLVPLSLSAVRVVSSAYLRLLIFLLAILIPVCDSSSSAFHMTYSTYKLNKQRDDIQPWGTLFEPVCCSMSDSNHCFSTCTWVSQETGQVVWYSHLLKNFTQFVVIHTSKGFSIADEADVFLELSCFF